ncbi:hypothetical protein [Thalassobacillus hwangdonensis]|uniref:Uncharacterized protein n=1 Tax=Thalassobacillus hwangdonensis TaxID=546108 RepID=A0ABW3L1E5_9BACI
MSEKFISIEEFNHLIQKWSGKTIRITKQELGDQDSVTMKLGEVDYQTDTRRIDGYEPMHVLHLHGSGTTQTDLEGAQPLPSDYYEIPLEDSSKYQFSNKRFFLSTERGTYTIEIV